MHWMRRCHLRIRCPARFPYRPFLEWSGGVHFWNGRVGAPESRKSLLNASLIGQRQVVLTAKKKHFVFEKRLADVGDNPRGEVFTE